MSFSQGDPVIYVPTKQKGFVIKVHEPGRGRQLYDVVIDGTVETFPSTSLTGDFNISDPYERMSKGLFGARSEFSQINTSHKIQNTSNSSVSTLKASNTIFKAYQFKPLLKFLNSDNRRILIADEVGLGKTIEAGHIMLELRARQELKRNSLIICPNSLKLKWYEELKKKFNLNYKIYESKDELINDISNRTVLGIINYEKIQKKKKPTAKPSVLEVIEERNVEFDFVLFDEAHRLRNSTTQLYRGAEVIVSRAKSVVMLTATPIMISEDNLYNLLHLLDPLAYDDKLTFRNQLNVNRPLVSALSNLNNNVPFKQIAEQLQNEEISLVYPVGDEAIPHEVRMSIHEAFNGVGLYERVIDDLLTLDDNPKNRVQIQFNLTNMSELNSIFSRTRKREVTTDMTQASRKPHSVIVELHDFERKNFDRIIEEYINDASWIDSKGNKRMTQGLALALVQKKRRVASSVFGYLNNEESLKVGRDDYAQYPDAKFERLLDVIQNVCVDGGKKLIVFAIFRKTLEYLRIRLLQNGIHSEIIHGEVDDRDQVLIRFKENSNVQILLSSEVGAEGLDLQFCDSLVNYDLPWNPMIVEQRIGRIDRFGQKAPVVNIYNFVVKGSIQEDIYKRLLTRIGIFERSIGDLEAILNKEVNFDGKVRSIKESIDRLDKIVYTKELTPEQFEERLSVIQQAIATEERHLKEISEGLTDAMTNDVYFRNEIEQIRRAYKYVTEKELYLYLSQLIRECLPTMSLNVIDERNMCYELVWPNSQPKLLKNFLEQYRPEDDDQVFNFLQFLQQIEGIFSFKFTLSQEFAYENPKWKRITAYHPIIVAAFKYFSKNREENNTTFQLGVTKESIPSVFAKSGTYFLATYSLTTYRRKYGLSNTYSQLIPIVYDAENDIAFDDLEDCEAFLGECQVRGMDLSITESVDELIIRKLRAAMAESIANVEARLLSQERMRLNTHMDQKRRRVTELFEVRISRQINTVEATRKKIADSINLEDRASAQRILPVQEANLHRLNEDYETALSRIQEAEIVSDFPKLLSMNRVVVY